jgi:hypothetical protein
MTDIYLKLLQTFSINDITLLSSILASCPDGFDINLPIPGDENANTLLHIAVSQRLEEVSNILLQHGASVYTLTNDRHTPITLAWESGNAKLVEVLLKWTTKDGGIPDSGSGKTSAQLNPAMKFVINNFIPSLSAVKLTRNALDTILPLELCIKTGVKVEDVEFLITKFEQFFRPAQEKKIEFYLSPQMRQIHLGKSLPTGVDSSRVPFWDVPDFPATINSNNDTMKNPIPADFYKMHSQHDKEGIVVGKTPQLDITTAQLLEYSTLRGVYQNSHHTSKNNIKFKLQVYTYKQEFYLHVERLSGEGMEFRWINRLFCDYFELKKETMESTPGPMSGVTNNNGETLGTCTDFQLCRAFLSQVFDPAHDKSHLP